MAIAAVNLDTRESTSPQGEKRLMLAVLEDAIGVIASGEASGRRGKLYWETRGWVSANDLEWPFSFVNVCGFLGLDPENVRRRIRRMTLRAVPSRGTTANPTTA